MVDDDVGYSSFFSLLLLVINITVSCGQLTGSITHSSIDGVLVVTVLIPNSDGEGGLFLRGV